MKKYAVGYISFFENNVIVELIDAEDFKSAIVSHSEIAKYQDTVDWINGMPNDLDEIKSQIFNGEISIDVKEIV